MKTLFARLRVWYGTTATRWIVICAGLSLIIGTVFASGTFWAYAFHNGQSGVRTHREERPEVSPETAADWFQRAHFGDQRSAPDARLKAMRQAAALPRSALGHGAQITAPQSGQPAGAQPLALLSSSALGTTPGTWAPLGPQPIRTAQNLTNAMNNWGLSTGRVTAVAVNPNDSTGKDIWVGTAGGGVWHTKDGGATWTAVSDSSTVNGGSWPTLSIGSIAIDPANGNPYTIYVGTGEANKISDGYWGVGVLKSTDGGATWTNYGFSNFAGLSIGKIAIDPSNHQNLLLSLATPNKASAVPGGANLYNSVGIWRSTNGGVSWSLVLYDAPSFDPDVGTDVLFDPANPSIVFAALGNIYHRNTSLDSGVWKSTDGGVTWTQLATGIPAGSNVERASLGISQDGTHVYAVISDAAFNDGGSRGNLLDHSIYVSTDTGATWAARDVSSVPGMASDDGEAMWWFDNAVGVDPTNSNVAYVGGVEVWKTTDGGTTWSNLTNAYGNSPTGVHPDQHAVVFFNGASSAFYLGNDGGVWSSADGGATFSDLNGGGLNITQFYGGSIGEVGAGAQLYGGTQDNGQVQYPAGQVAGAATWNEVYGDDGGQTVVDYTNNLTVYENDYFLGIHKSTDGGQTWSQVFDGYTTGDSVNFIAPLVADPSNHNVLVGGTNRVYRTLNGGGTWSAISPVLDPSWVPLSALVVAPNNDAYIYAGDNAGNVYMTSNGGSGWVGGAVAGSTGGMVRGIAVDPTDPRVVYASFAQFASSSGHHIFKSTNAGASWTDISTSLPNIPFEGILVSPNNRNLLIAGSDVGIFVSPDAGATWQVLGTGLPNVPINQIFTNHTGTRLFVATHGRGMWEMTFPDIRATPAAISLITPPGTNPSPNPQQVILANAGFGTLNWTLTSALPSWLTLSDSGGAITTNASRQVAPGGTDPLTVTFAIPPTDGPQTYSTTLVFSDPHADNSPLSIPVTVVAPQIATTWYFAEGYTGGSFTEFLTLANPISTAAQVQVTYYLSSGGPVVKTYSVPANTRVTLTVNSEVGAGQDVSMVVKSQPVAGYPSGVPIVAERPMYFTYTGLPGYTIPGGSDVLGATQLGTSFDFGYLDTSSGHDTWLTLLNQNNTPMTATLTYHAQSGGPPTVRTRVVPAHSRGTIHVNSDPAGPGAPGMYSALVTLDVPGLVERPLYLVDSTTGYTGSADVVGVAAPQPTWYFAEGFTSPTFSERYLVANPNFSGTATVTLTYYLLDGTTVSDRTTILPGHLQVFDVNARLGSGWVSNSAKVVATGVPVLAERFMSFRYQGGAGPIGTPCCVNVPGATDALGATAPGHLFLFAEGYTGGSFAEFLTLENPDPAQAAQVQVTFLPSNGGSPVVRLYRVAPNSRFTVYTNNVMNGTSFSLVVESSVAIVAERPMYFNHGGQTGGTDIVGYSPPGS